MGFKGSGAPGQTRTGDPLLRSYALQNSKCRFWCRLRGSASFISPLNWTEDGLKFVARTRERLWTLRSAEFVRRPHSCISHRIAGISTGETLFSPGRFPQDTWASHRGDTGLWEPCPTHSCFRL